MTSTYVYEDQEGKYYIRLSLNSAAAVVVTKSHDFHLTRIILKIPTRLARLRPSRLFTCDVNTWTAAPSKHKAYEDTVQNFSANVLLLRNRSMKSQQ